jgi:hypothetical protein
MPLPAGSPRPPALGRLLPASEHVLSESWVRLSGTVPQVVVTDTEPSGQSPNGNATDLVIYAWDNFARRWVNVLDAAKTPAPDSGFGSGDSEDVLPSTAVVMGLSYAPMTSTPGRTDLALWAGVNFGANSPFDAYVVHYNGQTASIAYSGGGEGGRAMVIGKAPHQRLSVTLQWVDPVDPECCAVRNFTQVISWDTADQSGTSLPVGYSVLSDTRSWLGVYLGVPDDVGDDTTPPPPVVMSVVPGSPAAGVLQPGDQLIAVAGIPARSAQTLLGPAIIDQIDSQLPGARVALTIDRGGQDLTEDLTLSSYANPAEQQASAPNPGYLGVSVSDGSYGSVSGAYLQSVEENSPADQAGLEEGDLITSIGSHQTTDAQDLTNVLLAIPAGTSEPIVYIDQDGQAHAVTIQLGSYPSANDDSDVVPPLVDEL